MYLLRKSNEVLADYFLHLPCFFPLTWETSHMAPQLSVPNPIFSDPLSLPESDHTWGTDAHADGRTRNTSARQFVIPQKKSY